MKRSRFYLGLVLLLGLLCVVNFFESKEVKTTNVTEAQVGYALSRMAKYRPGGPVEGVCLTAYTGTGAYLGMVGGPVGSIVGACAGYL